MNRPIEIHDWPSLTVDEWTATRDTLHMWTQIVGKIRMVHMPLFNHWWQVTLYVSPRGLTTGAIPYRNAVFDMEFDFVGDVLEIRHSDGGRRAVPLTAKPVAEFYQETLAALDSLGIDSDIIGKPNEVEPAIPFGQDYQHADYDPDAARAFWQQLVQAHRVMTRFRAAFVGKASPVQFFWGALDLACTRFSGRVAPLHPGGPPNCPDWVMIEGYSRELSSCGFWPGGGKEGAFYSYAYPQPQGFSAHRVEPDTTYFSDEQGEFLLPYEAVRTADDPDRAVARFLQTTYEAAAELGDWDRSALEDDPNRLLPFRTRRS
ncbi:MAG: hypothetical protein JWP83_1123 [Mycobacterium sp.]|jgi:hypothetical protein|uniref:DUF5996 family protein n=1 Tax=Mycobacterium sp. TaxID=1785 RepID=UPI0026389962|nr:DUF5996 family protein [Mycobacterium sp.]MCW2659971.1 hypothetical protein [Mycobacterium sp.]